MAAAPVGPSEGWGSVPFVEWVIGATWTAGLFVAGFAWRLASKVVRIETMVEERHAQNQQTMSDMLEEIRAIRRRMESEGRQNAARAEAFYRVMLGQKFKAPILIEEPTDETDS